MNQAIKILEEMIADANKSMYPEKWQLDMKEFNVFSCWKASLEIARDRILSLHSDTQWIDAIKRVQSLIDIELYDHDWASINESYLRWLEAALWEIKWEPPERNLIS
mgnify:FL=1